MSAVRLPILVCGEVVESCANGFHTVEYDTGARIEIPVLDAKTVQTINRADASSMASLHVDDITIFLSKLGKVWGDPEYPLRRKAVELAHRVTGISRDLIHDDYTRIARACDRNKLYDILETDLDSSIILDDWIPRQSVYVRAQPRGRVLHVLVGNVPMAGLFTLVRSVLTKNLTVAKLPKRDPVSSLFFALAFRELAPDHPITRSLSVVYWPGGADVEQTFIDAADVVCAWGAQSAMEAVKRKLRAGTEFIEFGPKRSLSLVSAGAESWDDVAMRAAYDASVYDQEACFSTQRIFVEGNAEAFVDRLAVWLEKQLAALPPAAASLDKQAHITRTRQEARFDGLRVVQSNGSEWTIVVGPPSADAEEHPLGRTVFVHPVADLREALPYITKEVQTVGVSPWQRGFELASDITARGALRVVELGMASRQRSGFVHDGTHPLRRMVRHVCVERGIDYKGKFRATDREAYNRSVFMKGMKD